MLSPLLPRTLSSSLESRNRFPDRDPILNCSGTFQERRRYRQIDRVFGNVPATLNLYDNTACVYESAYPPPGCGLNIASSFLFSEYTSRTASTRVLFNLTTSERSRPFSCSRASISFRTSPSSLAYSLSSTPADFGRSGSEMGSAEDAGELDIASFSEFAGAVAQDTADREPTAPTTRADTQKNNAHRRAVIPSCRDQLSLGLSSEMRVLLSIFS